MKVKPSGRSMDVRELHPWRAAKPIFFRVEGKVMEVMLLILARP